MPSPFFYMKNYHWRLQELIEHLKEQAPSLAHYLQSISENTQVDANHVLCIIEYNYIDESYSDEYSAYYSKQFRPPSRYATRLHLFDFGSSDPPTEADSATLISKAKRYLGFVVFRAWCEFVDDEIKPTIRIDQRMQARSISSSLWLPDWPSDHYLKLPGIIEKEVHFRGQTFIAKGVPFAHQDSNVGACAQSAIWIANRIMHHRFRKRQYLTSEITALAKTYSPYGRLIPSYNEEENGLTVFQMLTALNQMDCDALYYAWDGNKEATNTVLWRCLLAYVASGVPVVLVGRVGPTGHHAVTAFGYSEGPAVNRTAPVSHTKDLYLREYGGILFHDDQRGAYLQSQHWSPHTNVIQYPPDASGKKEQFAIVGMLVPLPGRLYLSVIDTIKAIDGFNEVWNEPHSYEAAVKEVAGSKDYFHRLRLVKAGNYLATVLKRARAGTVPIKFQQVLATISMPRYVWVAETCIPAKVDSAARVVATLILDATAEWHQSLLFQHMGRKAHAEGEGFRRKYQWKGDPWVYDSILQDTS